MTKLKKMLGNFKQPEIIAITKLIETQDKKTIAYWCIDYAENNYLPIYEKEVKGDLRPRITLDAAREWLLGKRKLPEVKNLILNACHQAAREAEDNPVAQAAARAVGQAASVIHVAMHALGSVFYGGTAVAYNETGLDKDLDSYNKIATNEFLKVYDSLKNAVAKKELK